MAEPSALLQFQQRGIDLTDDPRPFRMCTSCCNIYSRALATAKKTQECEVGQLEQISSCAQKAIVLETPLIFLQRAPHTCKLIGEWTWLMCQHLNHQHFLFLFFRFKATPMWRLYVVWAEADSELAMCMVWGGGRSMPLEAVWRHPEVSETCLKVVPRRNHVMGYYWDLNGVN